MRTTRFSATATMLIATAALVVGLAAPAAGHAAKHLINGSTIKKASVAGSKLKNNTVTGKQIRESTLGTVPSAKKATTATTAKSAQVADSLPALQWHTISTFENGWSNEPIFSRPAAYAIDAQGIVHLEGAITGGTASEPAFTFPAGVVPNGVALDLPVMTAFSLNAEAIVYQNALKPASVPGGAAAADVSKGISLEGISFAR